MKKYFAEMIGTFMLVLIGCGAAVFAADQVGQLGIAIAFGFTLVAIAYALGPISGGHVNPAVSAGMFIAKRITFKEFIGYVLFQLIGAFLAAYVLMYIASEKLAGYDVAVMGLGQNGYGEGYLAEFSMNAAIAFEFIATFIFVRVILEVTKAPNNYAGLVIGIMLMVLIIFGLQITGVSLNPARSFGPAILVGGQALQQLWVFIWTPLLAGILAGTCFKCCENGWCLLGTCETKNKKK